MTALRDEDGTHALLVGLLRGIPVRWPFAGEQEADAFLVAAARHGVESLVARQLRRGVLSGAPKIVEQTLATAALQQAIVEQRLAAEVTSVVAALARAGIPSLLMKGAALAYTCYPHPCLRPRTDTDLVVRHEDAAAVWRVFEALGYEPPNMTRGDLLLHQRSYERTDRLGIRHLYDVHWKIAAPHAVANLISWEELQANAVPVPALGIHAHAIGNVHAWVTACVHRMAHHYGDASLIWLYDIHMLASRLDANEWGRVLRLCEHEAAAAMCALGLSEAHECFGTIAPADLLETLRAGGDDSARRFGRGRMIDVLISDLKALPDWRQRLQLVREHVLPPADYIRALYGVRSPMLLPALYLLRAATGARKWLRPLAVRAQASK
jgi:hypothetical protein